ncbi:benzaldehyde dehydrogenase (NAD) [Amycolatopsis bartoniae]|uniref:Salicylaldehyde dehydrogenase n=1 Tax=Amycolatopsis bartoniae TaxID=941986 RepID=A0A8H9IT24_9PSEU|nr:aldehyde dehydrogenase family protein [Amycolatopsis bartoniae]MBB2938366.1 benzaldehyde dehydrogenase (NAD) [Amycolatopsis bartoniae]TVT10229.1 aldehyde dehydrogenase family protein [Amycolatopsis bartoniae]GHF34656.1 salicylaldehyde dehydrogenase [Amycolatopsis bartoniae]
MSEQPHDVRLLVGGEWKPSASGATITTTQATTGETVARVAAATGEDVDRAVEAAAAAADTWAATTPGQRRDVLEEAARVLAGRGDDITALMSREMGAASGWCRFNLHVAVGMLREAAAQTYSAVGEVIPSDVPGLTALGVRQPAGVTVGIAPWNAPLILGVRAVAMPLAYGNPVILKASEQTPGTHAEIARALHDAGVPAGAIGLVTNDAADAPAIVERLVAHPAVRRVNFTGSTRVGRIIGELAGKHLKRVLLELGGKAPMLVLRDADLDAAVDAAVFGAFMNQGQICMSTERIVVAAEVLDEFTRRLAARAGALKIGDAADPGTEIGPMVHEQACAHVEALIEDATGKGARLLAGGARNGLFFEPTVLRGVTPEMRIYHEESFGPVASVIEAGSEDDAVAIANDTRYGLSSAVFSTDVARALELAKRIRSGICHINGATVHDEPQMPFGGVGDSGFGRFGSRAALEEFTELRWLTIQAGSRHYPI